MTIPKAVRVTLLALILLAAAACRPQSVQHRFGGQAGQPAASPNFTAYLSTVSGVVATQAVQVHAISCTNRSGSTVYLMVLNSATALGGGGTPTYEWPIPSGTGWFVIGEDFFSQAGMYYSNGLAWGVSTTNGTYTAATAANHDCIFSTQ